MLRDENPVASNSVFSQINKIQYPDRYRELNDGRSWAMDISGPISDGKINLIMGTKRNVGLPQIEENGKRKPLKLSGSQGLFEPSHFSIFNNNVLGMEYNLYGPKTAAFKDYILKKADSLIDDVEITPIPRSDLDNLINSLGEVRLFDIAILPEFVEQIKKLDENLHAAFKQMKSFNHSRKIELVLKPSEESQSGIERFLGNFKQHKKDEELTDSLEKLKVKARNAITERIEWFDLLDSLVDSKKDIQKDGNSRSVDSNSMFGGIKDAFIENKSDITKFVEF